MKLRAWSLMSWAALAACGGHSGDDGKSPTGARISARLSSAGPQAGQSQQPMTMAPAPSSFAAGQTTAAGLISMKYFIRNISICEEMATSGTGFSNMNNCFSLYDGPQNPNLEYD